MELAGRILLIAIKMIFGSPVIGESHRDGKFLLVPLAVPLIAGPSSIAMVVLMHATAPLDNIFTRSRDFHYFLSGHQPDPQHIPLPERPVVKRPEMSYECNLKIIEIISLRQHTDSSVICNTLHVFSSKTSVCIQKKAHYAENPSINLLPRCMNGFRSQLQQLENARFFIFSGNGWFP